ncbi:sensor histidine kinase [Lutibacter citreus]|uniref:sensor histidine kinase n=1 Tax=Lutibacter citreus TaxID=2138210 RepID=UPI000DBE149D|nr:ATP-binding protein [Lutibacter citreus]
MIRKIKSLFTLLLITTSLFAQTTFISNFSHKEYNSPGQNWSIAQDNRGIMYFANNSGILEYDGVNWRNIDTQTRARSICIDSLGVIYVGLETDFGYLQPDNTGKLNYISLKEKIVKEHQDVLHIWNIYTLEGKVFFIADSKVYILQNNEIEVLVSDTKFSGEFTVNNRLYIQKEGGELYTYENESLRLLTNKEDLKSKYITEMLPFENDDILLTTHEQGVFIYNPNKTPNLWKPKGFEAVDNFLIKNNAFSGTVSCNSHFSISTSNDGIIVFDKLGKIVNHYNKLNGLQNDHANYLFQDLNHQLWITSENSISLIMCNLPFKNYTDKNGLDGSVYCVNKFKNKLYVGTSENLYIQNKESKFDRIKGTTGQNYYLFQANGKLLLGNSPSGIFEIKNNQAIQSKDFKKLGTSLAIMHLNKHPNHIIAQVADNKLALMEFQNKQWVFKHFIKGFNKRARYIVDDNNENLWLTANNHIYKLRLNKTLDSVSFLQEFSGSKFNLPDSFVMPYRLNNGEIIFASDKGIYRYLPDENDFEPHPGFPMFKNGVFHLMQNPNSNTIYFEEYLKGSIGEKGALKLVNGKYEVLKTPFLKFTDRSCTNAYSINPLSDSLVYFGTNLGALEYHPTQKVNYNIPFNTLIRNIYSKDSLFYAGTANDNLSLAEEPVTLKYKDNNLIFHYSATFYEESEKNLFSYRLIGSSDTKWSVWTTDHKKEYTNLNEGNYIFEVKSQNIYRKQGEIASYPFKILPPWQRTWLAYTLFGIFTMIFIWLLTRINSARLKRHNKLLQQIVNERTADISNQKEKLQNQAIELKANNKKLNILNSTKDKFFTIISHDLRSPFNGILGFSDILNTEYDSMDDADRKRIIGMINKSSKLAFELLDNLLIWARTQTGRIEINKEILNLKELVESSIAPYKFNASKKNIEIILNIPPDTELFIDRNTSVTFIGNLVNNAIKFTPQGGTITINYKENEDNIELHIIDTGVGMTAEVLGKLFRIDENISTNGTNNEKGTGLGLILCKEFINQNGGDISVISEVGKGSDFIITFSK